MKHFIKKQNRGATLIEMALAVGLIAMIALPAINFLGGKLKDISQDISLNLDAGGGDEEDGSEELYQFSLLNSQRKRVSRCCSWGTKNHYDVHCPTLKGGQCYNGL